MYVFLASRNLRTRVRQHLFPFTASVKPPQSMLPPVPCLQFNSPPSSDGERSTGKNRWLVVNRRIAIRFVVKPEVRHDQNHQQVGIACSALQVLLYIHSGRKLEMVPLRTHPCRKNLVFVDAAVNSSYLSSAGESYEILRAVLAQFSAIVFSHDKSYVTFRENDR